MKRSIATIGALAVVSSFMIHPADAAYTVKPKVGQCFMQTSADVSAPYARKNPIKCTSTHNAETYLVTKWPLKTKPELMDEDEALALADSLCRAWGDDGLIDNGFYTYWAWYTPDPAAWAKGERWLRCDAMVRNDAKKYLSWKGLQLGGGMGI